ncbi:molybdopterin converting factor subunit 1 [Gluconacetobacter tumulisoli]|uniref:Molybdopterin synthase sulfur carrier subunit n=1 Tax=Gluconacetobacter tumulisoli TaxID=1286189 RepID=A0A7W4K8X3_9PROT|nr:molybdopterin converting factor subunit 1 [Gluconacetobacter tumulisoli]
MITILYFAWLRDRLGRSSESMPLPEGARCVGDVIRSLAGREGEYQAVFGTQGGVVRCAVNQEFASPEDGVRAGDEIAFFPPVTGG